MLRTLLTALALLTASGTALAHEGYGRVVDVQPYFAISFGTPYPDGFRVLYESGGARYWTYTPYYPGRTIVLPPRHEVRYVYRDRDDRRGWGERRGWDEHRGWEGRRHERRYRDDDDD